MYVNVHQPLVGLKNMMFSKCLSVMLGAMWAVTKPTQLNSRSAAPAGKAT